MGKFKHYKLAVNGNMKDRWMIAQSFDKFIKELCNNNKDMEHSILSDIVFKFDYITHDVKVYYNAYLKK